MFLLVLLFWLVTKGPCHAFLIFLCSEFLKMRLSCSLYQGQASPVITNNGLRGGGMRLVWYRVRQTKVRRCAVRYCEFVSPFFFVLKIIILKELFIFILSVQVFCLQVCKCTACVPGTMDALIWSYWWL